jgi:hypothetical protein
LLSAALTHTTNAILLSPARTPNKQVEAVL